MVSLEMGHTSLGLLAVLLIGSTSCVITIERQTRIRNPHMMPQHAIVASIYRCGTQKSEKIIQIKTFFGKWNKPFAYIGKI